MPVYPYKCHTCGKQVEHLLPFDHDDPFCCGDVMAYQFTPFSFSVDFKDGWDDGAGKYFSTKRERDTWVSENNVRRIRS